MKKMMLVSMVVVLSAVFAYAEKKQDVTVSAADAAALKGTFYSAEKVGPGVLLLNQCNGNRQAYDHLGGMLSAAGYNALAFDFRPGDKMAGDVDAALKFLTSQNTVNTTALVVVAADCAVMHGVNVARGNPNIKGLVLLSGATDNDGETYIKNSKLPVLGIASEEDAQAAAAIKKAIEASTNRDSQAEIVKGAGHGTAMLEKQPDLEADIVIFLRSTVPIGGYGLKLSK
jgi:dienelactone hydrolase